MQDDPRLTEARAIPIKDIAERLDLMGPMRRTGREWAGPCPVCGGEDRFSIAPDRDVYNCRTCGGGDGLGLVQLALGLDFKSALAWLVGEADAEISAEERQRRAAQAERQRRERDEVADRKRRESIAAARAIWSEAEPAAGTPVEAYLSGRGLTPELLTMPRSLRFHPSLPYMVARDDGGWHELHRGPAMLAVIQAPSGGLIGVHRTWIDLDRPGEKARLSNGDEALPAKKVLGSVRGGAIRLCDRRCAADSFDTMVMGEGIETTGSAMVADAVPGAAYWAGVSLPNMSGRRILRGEGMKYAGVPDLDDTDAFIPPPWLTRLISIQDGDSEPKATRAKLVAGLRRAKHHNPELSVRIVHAGDGVDLNDVLRGETPA